MMTPTTGVTNLNRSAGEWFWEGYLPTAIEPAYEEARVDRMRAFVEAHTTEVEDGQVDFEGYDSEDEMLIAAEDAANEELEDWNSDCYLLLGDWERTNPDAGLLEYPTYDIDKEGKHGWAGIYRRDTGSILQVVWSKFTMMSHYCSPCYPNQSDLDTDGDSMLGYCLPPDEWDDGWKDENFHRLVNPDEWREAA